METLPEFVGTVHIFLGPYRGNPIALYMLQGSDNCRISPRIYPWSQTIGIGENPNKAAADFEAKWKENGLSSEMYSGPHWEGGIKPEKPKPAAPPKPPASDPKPVEAGTTPSTTSAPEPSGSSPKLDTTSTASSPVSTSDNSEESKNPSPPAN